MVFRRAAQHGLGSRFIAAARSRWRFQSGRPRFRLPATQAHSLLFLCGLFLLRIVKNRLTSNVIWRAWDGEPPPPNGISAISPAKSNSSVRVRPVTMWRQETNMNVDLYSRSQQNSGTFERLNLWNLVHSWECLYTITYLVPRSTTFVPNALI